MRFSGKIKGPAPKDKVEHFAVCRHCRQVFDRRNLPEVVWHEIPDHEPAPAGEVLTIEYVLEFVPADLREVFFPTRRPKAGSIYRGINVEMVKVKR